MSFPTGPEWVEAMEAAVTEVITQAGGSLPDFEPSKDGPGADTQGAYVSLMSPEHSVRIGIVARPEVLHRLAAFMVMDEVDPADLQDATCELANVIAGNVRKFLNARAPDLRLGLPVFSARQPPTDRYAVTASQVKLPDDSQALLLVMLPRPATAA